MTDELLRGLRDDDLTDEERRRRDALLGDPARRRAHEADLRLGARIAALPDVPRGVVLPARRRGVLGALAVAAAVLIAVGVVAPDAPALRARGLEPWATATVTLRAAAEGAGGARRLDDGAHVAAAERVVFEVETAAAGELVLEEVDGAVAVRVWPAADAAWTVQAGRHLVGGERPRAWQPDAPGPHRYRATFCPADGGACAQAEVGLVWEAE